jgi:diacylglycerol kinase (ATP)
VAGQDVEEKPIAVVLNPGAGGGKTLKVLPRVHEALKALNRPYHVYLTTAAGDGEAAAARFAQEGASVVLAVGGDGTIQEVANGLCSCKSTVPMGVVPTGNGSDFARTIGASKKVEESIAKACSGYVRAIDVGLATFEDGTSRIFTNIAGLGFDSIVAERAARTKFLPGANLPYLAASLRTLVNYKNIDVSIDIDGQIIETRAVFVQVANAKFMGGGYKIAPTADIEDGLLDLALVGDLTKSDLLKTLPKVYSGNHVHHPKFQLISGKRIRVETAKPARVQLDGELIGSAPVTFSVLPGALMLAG